MYAKVLLIWRQALLIKHTCTANLISLFRESFLSEQNSAKIIHKLWQIEDLWYIDIWFLDDIIWPRGEEKYFTSERSKWLEYFSTNQKKFRTF